MGTISIKSIEDYRKLRDLKLPIVMDTRMLDSIMAFIYKESVLKTRKALMNIQKLFNLIDKDKYVGLVNLEDRIWIIETSLTAILKKGFDTNEMIKQFCIDSSECSPEREEIINGIENLKITHEESRYLIRSIEDRLQFGYTVVLKEVMQDYFDRVDMNDFKTYSQINDELVACAQSLVNNRRNTRSGDSDAIFTLEEEKFDVAITDCVTALKDKNKIFTTGIRRLNSILSPGYLSKRLYTYLALPGGGKSQILLKSALDIKKYNGHVEPKDPNKLPAVLYITMENDVNETIERVFNMIGNPDDIRNYTPKQVIKILKRDGQLAITEDNKINIIIQYYANRTIDTNDLYSIIKDLDDSGNEVIALILDYMKRIKPAEPARDEKEELKNITNELKTLAQTLDVPVITAQQLNRNAASVIDAAIRANKEDLAKLLGRDNVGSAWEIIENSDMTIILQQEKKRSTGELFMSFKMVKRRYKGVDDDKDIRELDYFSHPYEVDNTICLIDDVNLPKSISVYSLKTDFVDLDESKRGKRNAIERPKEKKKELTNDSIGVFSSPLFVDDEFNPDKSYYA